MGRHLNSFLGELNMRCSSVIWLQIGLYCPLWKTVLLGEGWRLVIAYLISQRPCIHISLCLKLSNTPNGSSLFTYCLVVDFSEGQLPEHAEILEQSQVGSNWGWISKRCYSHFVHFINRVPHLNLFMWTFRQSFWLAKFMKGAVLKSYLGKQHIHLASGRLSTTNGITQIIHWAKGVPEHINLTRRSAVTEMVPLKLYEDTQYYINISSFLLFILPTGDTSG